MVQGQASRQHIPPAKQGLVPTVRLAIRTGRQGRQPVRATARTLLAHSRWSLIFVKNFTLTDVRRSVARLPPYQTLQAGTQLACPLGSLNTIPPSLHHTALPLGSSTLFVRNLGNSARYRPTFSSESLLAISSPSGIRLIAKRLCPGVPPFDGGAGTRGFAAPA